MFFVVWFPPQKLWCLPNRSTPHHKSASFVHFLSSIYFFLWNFLTDNFLLLNKYAWGIYMCNFWRQDNYIWTNVKVLFFHWLCKPRCSLDLLNYIINKSCNFLVWVPNSLINFVSPKPYPELRLGFLAAAAAAAAGISWKMSFSKFVKKNHKVKKNWKKFQMYEKSWKHRLPLLFLAHFFNK